MSEEPQKVANPNRVNWEMVHAYANSSDKSTRYAAEDYIFESAHQESQED